MNDKQKEKISSKLSEIVESAIVINKEMESALHKKTMVYKHLGHRNNLTSTRKGLLAEYLHTDGKLYHVAIHELLRG